jgi:hypothetical protein
MRVLFLSRNGGCYNVVVVIPNQGFISLISQVNIRFITSPPTLNGPTTCDAYKIR